MKNTLITGGAGFVGSHLAIGLKAHKSDVRVIALDNLRRRGSELNLPRLRAGGVEFVHGDVRQVQDLEAVGPVDFILECSAEPSVLAGYGEAPNYVVDTNLTGAINCFEIARRHSAAVIFLSTSRVYPMETLGRLAYCESETRFELAEEQSIAGASVDGISDAFPLDGVRSLYGATKLAAEMILAEYSAMYQLPAIINRCGVLTGPWQMGKIDQGVVVLWAARHIFGGALSYIGYGGQGKQVRDMLHVSDLLSLVDYQMEHVEALSGETYNVGGGHNISASLLEMTTLCEQITGNTIEIGSDSENRPADIPLYITDNAKVTKETGWKPTRGVEEIFGEVCAWIESHRESLTAILS